MLQTLRDRLTVEQAAHLSAQLPMVVREEKIDEGEIAKVQGLLPDSINRLWPTPA